MPSHEISWGFKVSTKHVYTAIARVMAQLAKTGIGKDRRNEQQNYKFRGIDDMYNALAPMLAAEGLMILPRLLSRDVTERTTAKGGVLFYVVVVMEFDFVSSNDGSTHTVRMAGEAMDSGDKATNKAMSAAYKYACMQAFCIPTEGDNDADATTHEVVYRQPATPPGLLEAARTAALDGVESFRAYWSQLSPKYREALKAHLPALKEAAQSADSTTEVAG